MDRCYHSTELTVTNMRHLAILRHGRTWLALLGMPLVLCALVVADNAWADRRSAWIPPADSKQQTGGAPVAVSPVAAAPTSTTKTVSLLGELERLPAPSSDADELLTESPPAIPPPRPQTAIQAGHEELPQPLFKPGERTNFFPETVRDDWQKDVPRPPQRAAPQSETASQPNPLPAPIDTEELPAVDANSDDAFDARLLDEGPWWSPLIAQQLRHKETPKAVALPEVVMAALYHSEYVRGISLQPQIQETEIVKNQADFDPTAFLESKWQDLNDPVGNTLTTGGANRFLDNNLNNRIGLRRKNSAGGVLELEQNAGLRDTNSVFFVPGNQALTQLAINYSQPLLRGAGQTYNQSLIVMAEIDTRQSRRDVQRQLQDHVLKVVQGYWELSLQRALFLQRLRARERALEIQRELEARKDWDVVQSQLLRARAAIALRTASLARADAAIRNAETRLRVLTNAPELSAHGGLELLPVELPPCQFQPPVLTTEMQIALAHRPEIDVALERIRSSEVRLGMADNELRPSLNLVLQGYAKGLQGNNDVLRSLGDQFAVGGPSYTTGLIFEAPLGNRSAQAKVRRRSLEVQQLMHEFQNTLANVSGEVEIAIREVEATYREFLGQQRAVLATDAEVSFLLQRWRVVPGHDRSAALLLEDALNAQDRLVTAEATLAQTQRDFAVSIATLRRNTGTLLGAQTCQPAAVAARPLVPQTQVSPPSKTVQLAPFPAQKPLAAAPSSVAQPSANMPPPSPNYVRPPNMVSPPAPTRAPVPVATRPAGGRPSSAASPTPIAIPR